LHLGKQVRACHQPLHQILRLYTQLLLDSCHAATAAFTAEVAAAGRAAGTRLLQDQFER
jgi:hypothetical protein